MAVCAVQSGDTYTVSSVDISECSTYVIQSAADYTGGSVHFSAELCALLLAFAVACYAAAFIYRQARKQMGVH